MESRVEEQLLGSEKEEERDLKRRILVESKIFWRVAGPAILTRISSFGIFVVTQSFMGHISEVQLSPYALVLTVLTRFGNGILLGMSTSLETLCGQAFGAKQYHMMGIYMQRSWIVVMATGILLLPFYIFATPMFRLLGQTDELSEAAGKVALWFIPVNFTFVFSCTMQMFLQSQLKNSIIGWLAGISFLLHLLLSWVTVEKLDWGVAGALGSMVLTTWLSVIGQFVYIFGGWCPETWKGFSKSAFSELWPVTKLSISSGVMICLQLWYNSVLLLFAGLMHNATISIAAFSICLNISGWVLMVFLGFFTASTVRVSNELGRGNAKAAKFSIKVVLGTSISIGMVVFILILSLGTVISYAFSSSEEVAKAVSSLSLLLASAILLSSIQSVFNGVAVGAGWQSAVAYVNICCYYVVGIPFGLLLAYVAHLHVKGIWIGMISGTVVQTLVLIYMTGKTDWDHQVQKATARLDGWLLPDTNDNSPRTLEN